jgi:hypothetical protein
MHPPSAAVVMATNVFIRIVDLRFHFWNQAMTGLLGSPYVP